MSAADLKLPTSDNFRCCGCGAASLDRVKPCDCASCVGSRSDADGKCEYVVFISKEIAARLALSGLIKTRILGVHPDDQDLALDDFDWMRIVAALESRP